MTRVERAALYRLLARVVVDVPDEATIRALAPFVDASPAAAPALEVAFAQLFLLPGGIPPYVGRWVEGDPQGASLSRVVDRVMDALGLSATDVGGRLALDHVSLVLSVVAISLEDEALASVGACVERRLIGAWTARFGRALRARSEHPLYRAVGEAFVALCEEPTLEHPGRGAPGSRAPALEETP